MAQVLVATAIVGLPTNVQLSMVVLDITQLDVGTYSGFPSSECDAGTSAVWREEARQMIIPHRNFLSEKCQAFDASLVFEARSPRLR